MPLTASAVVIEDLFEVEMPVLDETKAIRQAALDDGLIEVLIRVSGDSKVLEKVKAPAASSYVKQFRYSVQAAEKEGGEPSKWLWVRYNETKVLDYLRKQAVPVWAKHRSQLVIWLAVRDGGQRYILKDSDVSLIKSKTDEALARRAIPVVWPKNDTLDQQNVRFADIWAGFPEPIKQASKRYSTGPVIAANMSWNGRLWRGDWTLLMDGDVHKWSLSGGDYAVLIARAIDLLVDAMGKKFAVLEAFDVSQQNVLTVEVAQVASVQDFRHIEKYLSSLSAVRSVQLSQLEPERVFFDLTLRTKAEDLLTLIQSGSVLALVTEEDKKEKLVAIDAHENVMADVATSDVPLPQPPKLASYRFVLR
ncbi:MAG: DUF2066 domain-containing protein [Gammaproteobacteria bacterium]|nr:DUF2066 domain-containing protein [Gammaproteobacteria bacterium]